MTFVGRRVEVWWPPEDPEDAGVWYTGTIVEHDAAKGYFCRYDDGDEEWFPEIDGATVKLLPDNKQQPQPPPTQAQIIDGRPTARLAAEEQFGNTIYPDEIPAAEPLGCTGESFDLAADDDLLSEGAHPAKSDKSHGAGAAGAANTFSSDGDGDDHDDPWGGTAGDLAVTAARRSDDDDAAALSDDGGSDVFSLSDSETEVTALKGGRFAGGATGGGGAAADGAGTAVGSLSPHPLDDSDAFDAGAAEWSPNGPDTFEKGDGVVDRHTDSVVAALRPTLGAAAAPTGAAVSSASQRTSTALGQQQRRPKLAAAMAATPAVGGSPGLLPREEGQQRTPRAGSGRSGRSQSGTRTAWGNSPAATNSKPVGLEATVAAAAAATAANAAAAAAEAMDIQLQELAAPLRFSDEALLECSVTAGRNVDVLLCPAVTAGPCDTYVKVSFAEGGIGGGGGGDGGGGGGGGGSGRRDSAVAAAATMLQCKSVIYVTEVAAAAHHPFWRGGGCSLRLLWSGLRASELSGSCVLLALYHRQQDGRDQFLGQVILELTDVLRRMERRLRTGPHQKAPDAGREEVPSSAVTAASAAADAAIGAAGPGEERGDSALSGTLFGTFRLQSRSGEWLDEAASLSASLSLTLPLLPVMPSPRPEDETVGIGGAAKSRAATGVGSGGRGVGVRAGGKGASGGTGKERRGSSAGKPGVARRVAAAPAAGLAGAGAAASGGAAGASRRRQQDKIAKENERNQQRLLAIRGPKVGPEASRQQAAAAPAGPSAAGPGEGGDRGEAKATAGAASEELKKVNSESLDELNAEVAGLRRRVEAARAQVSRAEAQLARTKRAAKGLFEMEAKAAGAGTACVANPPGGRRSSVASQGGRGAVAMAAATAAASADSSGAAVERGGRRGSAASAATPTATVNADASGGAAAPELRELEALHEVLLGKRRAAQARVESLREEAAAAAAALAAVQERLAAARRRRLRAELRAGEEPEECDELEAAHDAVMALRVEAETLRLAASLGGGPAAAAVGAAAAQVARAAAARQRATRKQERLDRVQFETDALRQRFRAYEDGSCRRKLKEEVLALRHALHFLRRRKQDDAAAAAAATGGSGDSAGSDGDGGGSGVLRGCEERQHESGGCGASVTGGGAGALSGQATANKMQAVPVVALEAQLAAYDWRRQQRRKVDPLLGF